MDEPPQADRAAQPDARPRPRAYRLPRVPDEQVAKSREMILEAAAGVAPAKAIVLGAGRCTEIPLAELARGFGRVVINDIEHQPCEELLRDANLTADDAAKLQFQTEDLTGLTERLKAAWQDLLAAETNADAAAEAMLRGIETTSPEQEAASEQYELVVASCVLSQLHNATLEAAIRLFASRFPVDAERFRASQRTAAAFYRLAREMESRFIDRLAVLTAPGGRIYLSESVQMCFIEFDDADHWSTEGTLRMTRTTNLADYLDQRFESKKFGRWNWVVNEPQAKGQRGRLFDVQAMILAVRQP